MSLLLFSLDFPPSSSLLVGDALTNDFAVNAETVYAEDVGKRKTEVGEHSVQGVADADMVEPWVAMLVNPRVAIV